jgi:H+/Cl- antiporter ClcA
MSFIFGFDINTLILVLAIVAAFVSALAFLLIFYIKLKKSNPNRFYSTVKGKRFDFDLIQDCIIKSIILGVSVFASINTIYYGITEIWLLPYSYDLARIGLIIGGILFIFFSVKEVYNFMKDKEEEFIVTPKKAGISSGKNKTQKGNQLAKRKL